ncbi:MAG: alpha/beta hydrolase [Sphaerospermopsis sp. SIO1G2]|nr:alpha/beta hydrolase [Sphaerospermopsis sp. SIO1G1]NET71892.1 alpha/beta hydrolase [Sphaerospermopsis sp. SIO1G2]
MQPKMLQLPLQKIAYYESYGTGKPIILIHGNSSSGLSYQKQFNSPLGAKYRLIAIDLPGHGYSEPFAEMSAYSIPGYAAVVAATAEALDVQDAIFVGSSLGGHIILEAQSQLPQAQGLVIFGTPPLATVLAIEELFLPNEALKIGFKADISVEEAQAYATSFFAPGVPVPQTPFINDILRTDGKARAGLAASVTQNAYEDEVEIVANLPIPLAIFHGQEEQLVNELYFDKLTIPTLWQNQVQVIAGAGHVPHWETPERFNELLENFMMSV